MKPSALLINHRARRLVDEQALAPRAPCAFNDAIGGAGLRCPVDRAAAGGQSAARLRLPNLVVTPHVACRAAKRWQAPPTSSSRHRGLRARAPATSSRSKHKF